MSETTETYVSKYYPQDWEDKEKVNKANAIIEGFTQDILDEFGEEDGNKIVDKWCTDGTLGNLSLSALQLNRTMSLVEGDLGELQLFFDDIKEHGW